MTPTMSSRERVLTALHHQEPDRVPTALWGSYYSLVDETYFRLLKHLDLGSPTQPFRRYKPRNTNYLDDRVLDRLGTDLRYVWSGFTDLGGAHPKTLVDAWGIPWQHIAGYISPAGAPLADASLEDIMDYSWPQAERFMRLEEAGVRARRLHSEGQYAVAARAVNSYGPFEQACALRGREQLLMDLLLDPELARALILKVAETIARLQAIYLDVVGPYVDIVELPGDDYAGNEHLLISPKLFEEMIKPALERLVRPIKQLRSDLFVTFHSDGAISRLLPYFVEMGIDIVHPLEPLPANDLAAIKLEYGDRISFLGAIDIKQAMPGSTADVETEAALRIEQLAAGGGYILAPANHLQADVPAENIVALYEAARQHGRYAG